MNNIEELEKLYDVWNIPLSKELTFENLDYAIFSAKSQGNNSKVLLDSDVEKIGRALARVEDEKLMKEWSIIV